MQRDPSRGLSDHCARNVVAQHAGVPAIPGGFTPGELGAAQAEGPAALKLFPAVAVTPEYLRVLAPVLGSPPVIATGGIASNAEAIRPWLAAGAVAVALGSALGTARTVGAEEVERRCRVVVAAVC